MHYIGVLLLTLLSPLSPFLVSLMILLCLLPSQHIVSMNLLDLSMLLMPMNCTLVDSLLDSGGGAIAYKAKVQATVATSSTESEFIAAVSATKIAKYLRSVPTELDYPPKGATPLYEDNAAAIAMINDNRPTPAPVTLTFNTLLSKNGVNVELLSCLRFPASSTLLIKVPKLLAGSSMLVMPWTTLVVPHNSFLLFHF